MKVLIPTYNCRAVFRMEMTVNGATVPPGVVISVPFAMAMFAEVTGTGTIFNKEQTLNEAAEHLQQYGGDSLFPTSLQTLHKLGSHYKLIERDDAGHA